MHESKRVVGTGLLFVLAACSGPSASRLSGGRGGSAAAPATASTSTSAPLPATTPPQPGKTTLFRFEGSVDVSAKTVALNFFTPSGDAERQITLPYGTGAGEVYFHTCATPTYGPDGTGNFALSATVSAVNNLGLTVNDFTVNIPTIVPTGAAVFTTSLNSDDYGTVDGGASSPCATWTFTQMMTTQFYFQGTAEGTTAASMANECTGTPSLFASVGTAEAITTDGMNVYWSDVNSSTIYTRAVGGTGSTVFLSGVAGGDLAIDGTNLYVTDFNDGDVYAVPLASPALGTSLSSGSPNGGYGVAAIGSEIYYSDSTSTINETSIGMTNGTPFITTATAAYGLGSLGSLLYVADNGVPAIDVYDTLGTLQSGDTIALSEPPEDVTADSNGVYWTDYSASSPGHVLELKSGASTAVTLATGSQPVGIAVDSKCVYYADNGTNSYMVVAKQ